MTRTAGEVSKDRKEMSWNLLRSGKREGFSGAGRMMRMSDPGEKGEP